MSEPTTEEKSILRLAEDAVEGPRQETYGSPLENFTRIADMATAMLKDKIVPGERLTFSDIARLFIITKVARESFSGRRDNLVDIAGYAHALDLAHDEHDLGASAENCTFTDCVVDDAIDVKEISMPDRDDERDTPEFDGEFSGVVILMPEHSSLPTTRQQRGLVKTGDPLQKGDVCLRGDEAFVWTHDGWVAERSLGFALVHTHGVDWDTRPKTRDSGEPFQEGDWWIALDMDSYYVYKAGDWVLTPERFGA